MIGGWSGAFFANLLAQVQGPAKEAVPGAEPAAPGFFEGLGLLPIFVVITILFYFMLIRPQKREQATRQSMLAQLKKNDRVLTSGGLYGIVVNVHQSADEVTLKVDEASNTRLKVTRSSIVRVLGDEPAEAAESKGDKDK